ncbi:MAG: iron-containing alcohol dehydrogenase family protein [Promethearchaeota archaeon]
MTKFSDVEFPLQAPRVFFGRGTFEKVPSIAKDIAGPGGREVTLLVCTGSSFSTSPKFGELLDACGKVGIKCVTFTKPPGEPTVEMVGAGTEFARREGVNVVVGVGGGSVMDAGKAIAGMLTNPGSVADYQDGRPFPNRMAPYIAVPTTAGTGSEVSNNSVLIDPTKGLKASVRGENLRPWVALVDPELTISAPPKVTAYSGMDALTQAVEAYVARAATYLSDMFAERAISLIAGNLLAAFNDGSDLEARSGVALGSLLSGLAFSNSKLGAVHGFAHPIGVKHGIAHGLICGLLLPHVMKYNLPVVAEKYARVAELIGGSGFLENSLLGYPKSLETTEKATWSVRAVQELLAALQFPTKLSDIGIGEGALDDIVADTRGGSLANNPRDTDRDSLKDILLGAL